MLCAKCKNLFTAFSSEYARRERWANIRNPVESLLCDRCGTVLPSHDPAEAMLSKLSQLSKFGIGADDRPILTSPGRKE